MLDGCADVFHSGFVAAFAFAIAVFTFPLAAFAVLVALGHFGFHVAKQFFGFFVFAFFAKLIDCAFSLFNELPYFVIFFPLSFLIIAFTVIAFTVFTLVSGSVTIALTVAFARFAALTFTGFVAIAIAPFVVVVGPCGPSETHAGNQQRSH
jgi:hypothetical protein